MSLKGFLTFIVRIFFCDNKQGIKYFTIFTMLSFFNTQICQTKYFIESGKSDVKIMKSSFIEDKNVEQKCMPLGVISLN